MKTHRPRTMSDVAKPGDPRRFTICEPGTDRVILGFRGVSLDNAVFTFLGECTTPIRDLDVGASTTATFRSGVGVTDATVVRCNDAVPA